MRRFEKLAEGPSDPYESILSNFHRSAFTSRVGDNECVANHAATATALQVLEAGRWDVDRPLLVKAHENPLSRCNGDDGHLKHVATIILRLRKDCMPMPNLPTCRTAFSLAPTDVSQDAIAEVNASFKVPNIFCIWQVV